MHHFSAQEECLDDEVLAHLSRLRYGVDYNTDGLEIYACCVPASGKIPGDYVGVVRNGNDALIVTTDGMGKGLRAFPHAHSVTQRFFIGTHTQGVEQALDELFRAFAEKSGRGKVMFSAFMLLDMKEEGDGYRLSIYGMGQPSPLIYRAGSKMVDEVPSLSGVAIGIPIRLDGRKPYGVFSTYLDVGDRLLAYSDGVTEARNQQGTMFSEANTGLKKSFLCSVKKNLWKHTDEIAQDILYDIMEHCGEDMDEECDVTLQDDITVAVVRVKDPGARPVKSRRKK